MIKKFDMYFEKGTDTNVGYVKRMTDSPIPKKTEHSYSKAKKLLTLTFSAQKDNPDSLHALNILLGLNVYNFASHY